jgi:hypothetical protein
LPIAHGIEPAREELAQIGTRHPLGDRDQLSLDAEFDEGHAAILHLPGDGSFSTEKGVKRVFDLDGALVAGIINNALAT